MVLVVVAAHEVLCGKGGHAAGDGLAAVGVARGCYLVIIGELHLINMLRRVGGELRLIVGIELLAPELRVSALLQLIGHVAVLQLVGGHLLALLIAAGFEVVAVRDGGVGGEGVAAGGIVIAEVEAVVQGAGAVLDRYKSAHAFLTFLHGGVDRAFDEAVGDGDAGVAAYI